MLLGRGNFRLHLPWIVIVIFATLGIVFAEYSARSSTNEFPRGSSVIGFSFGVAGGLIILFEFLLWPRKWLRRIRMGRTRTWMLAHIWLGLLSVPLIICHSGFRFGYNMSTALTILFGAVIASGIWGWVMQMFIPDVIRKRVAQETIFSSIDPVIDKLHKDAYRLIDVICGAEYSSDIHLENVSQGDVDSAATALQVVDVGRSREVGNVVGFRVSEFHSLAPFAGDTHLTEAFHSTIEPFLRLRTRSGFRELGRSGVSKTFFEQLSGKVSPDAQRVIDVLSRCCEIRRDLDLQRRLHYWLHGWLLIHLPLSIFLVLMMLVHVYYSLLYW